MPIQGSGEIKFSQIASQFGRTLSNISARLFYRGGGIVPDIPENSSVPNSGEIKFSKFFATQSGVGDGTFIYRDIRFDANGWAITGQFLAETSRIVYISNTGNDTLAANNQHGRGYYLYNDDEIGADPTEPIGEVYAYQTLTAAYTAARYSGFTARTPNPDWLLFKRGDTFDLTTTTARNLIGAQAVGGTASNARRVFGAYGNPSAAQRPKLIYSSQNQIWANCSNLAFLSLEFEPSATSVADGIEAVFRALYGQENIFIEDILCRSLGGFSGGESKNTFFRRCVVIDAWHPNTKGAQGLYLSGCTGKTTVSECLFDNNAPHNDPRKPSTWTGAVWSDAALENLPPGQGVQPRRSYHSRNIYASSYDDLLLENSIISRGNGGGCIQMRVGGVAVGNAFIWNQSAIAAGGSEASREKSKNFTAENNLLLHDDHLFTQGANGVGITLGSSSNIRSTVASALNNLILHFHEGLNGGTALFNGGGNPFFKTADPLDGDLPETILQLARMYGNTMVQLHAGQTPSTAGLTASLEIGNNDFLLADTTNAAFYNVGIGQTAVRNNPNFLIGTPLTGGNHIYAPGWTSYATTWQGAGKDTASTRYTTIQQMVTARGWNANAINEDIVTYMQSLDPSYVPDEEMTVDDLVQIAPADRRPDAPKVWFVLRNPSLYKGTSAYNHSNPFSPSDAQAKLTARRCHAFNRFMSFARQNRKGNWNPDYTAKNLNNYFRALYNKPPV